MNSSSMTPRALMILCCAALAGAASAQHKAHDHAAQPPAASTQAAAPAGGAVNTAEMSDAEVRRVDKGAGKLTLKHGEIKHLDMPPMTMVFQVPDATLLDKVKPGDKVRFRAEKAASGYVVTAVEVVK
ncbi:MAG: copper-binding protein [Rubrivivax sp.]